MQDRVGSHIPSEQEVDDLVAQIQVIEAKVAKYTVLLTDDERAAALRFRKGGESIVPTIADLVVAHGLTMPGITPKGMEADLLLSQRIRPLVAASKSLFKRLDDTFIEAQGECWWAATAFYTALNRVAGANPALAAALKPLVAFFARKKKEPAPAPTPPNKATTPAEGATPATGAPGTQTKPPDGGTT